MRLPFEFDGARTLSEARQDLKVIVGRRGSVVTVVDRDGGGAWDPNRGIQTLEIDEQQFRGAFLTTLDGDDYFTVRLDLGWGCVFVGDEMVGHRASPAPAVEVEPGFIGWGETLTILRALADGAVPVEGSSTWELGRRGPPSGPLDFRRDNAGTEIRVGDRLTVRLDKKRYRGAWLESWGGEFRLDIDTGLNTIAGSTRQIRGPAAALPRAAWRRRPPTSRQVRAG